MTNPLPHPLKVFTESFQKLSTSSLHLVDEIYAPGIHFIDPIHEIHGREALRKYFASLYDGVVHSSFDFSPAVISGNEASIPWVMHMEHGRFRRGRRVHVPGISHLRFEDQITYHRDYFDLGTLIYERVPLLGGVIRTIKARL